MEKVQMLPRTKDMFSGKQDLEPLYTFKNFPVYCGVADNTPPSDIFADMKWAISKGSGMVQLEELVPPELLYSKSHNASIGKTWERHHREFADFLYQYAGKDAGILEIGGGNGILNAFYNEKYAAKEWVIVDPTSVEVIKGCNARYVSAMWTKELDLQAEHIEFNTLVHSHLMEHQYDLQAFMELNASKLTNGQRMIFTVPDLKEWVRRKYANALFFEHTYLITEDYIDIILPQYGFKVLNKCHFGDGHSLFYATEKQNMPSPKADINYHELYTLNRSLFIDAVSYYTETTRKANEFIEKADTGVCLFGAHIFSQFLINSGLCVEKIKGILDNDPLKQGKRLYGTNLTVFSPKVLQEEKDPWLILYAGAYTQEIKKDILENINESTHILG